jgi:hypothetical protein
MKVVKNGYKSHEDTLIIKKSDVLHVSHGEYFVHYFVVYVTCELHYLH